MNSKTSRSIRLATIALGLAATSLHAQSIANGSFETNPPKLPERGWAIISPSSDAQVDDWITGRAFVLVSTQGFSQWTSRGLVPHEGNYAIALQDKGSETTIEQSLSKLVVGTTYQISLYVTARNNASMAGALSVKIDNGKTTSVIHKGNPPGLTWKEITCRFVATTPNPQLIIGFTSTNEDQTVFVDKVTLAAIK